MCLQQTSTAPDPQPDQSNLYHSSLGQFLIIVHFLRVIFQYDSERRRNRHQTTPKYLMYSLFSCLRDCFLR